MGQIFWEIKSKLFTICVKCAVKVSGLLTHDVQIEPFQQKNIVIPCFHA